MMSLPRPTGTFHWTETAAGPALVCGALTRYAAHLFSTRPWTLGSSSRSDTAEGWREVAAAMHVDAADLVRVHQVHGKAAVIVRRRDGAGQGDAVTDAPPHDPPDADILITQDPDVAIAIQTADCVPILIADRKRSAVAAVHAGW